MDPRRQSGDRQERGRKAVESTGERVCRSCGSVKPVVIGSLESEWAKQTGTTRGKECFWASSVLGPEEMVQMENGKEYVPSLSVLMAEGGKRKRAEGRKKNAISKDNLPACTRRACPTLLTAIPA